MSEGGGDDRFEQLKSLILGDTALRLEGLEPRVEKIDAFVGDGKRLEAATARILVEALRKAEVERHDELSQAVAPLVVAAIRSEIKNSKDMMVEALYPITGRLVTAAVAHTFSDLVEDLNRRIDALTSTHVWRMRIRAIATGRSMAEVALAETESGRLRRALLLERGSGRALAAWPDNTTTENDADLVSGMIAAITEFASTVYADRSGELRSLDLGSGRVFLRASPRVIIAAELSGELAPHTQTKLDEAFLSLVELHEKNENEPTSEAIGKALNDALQPPPAPPASKTPIRVVAAVAAGLAIWAAVGPATRAWRERRIGAAYSAAMAQHPALADFPLRLDIDHTEQRVTLRGLSLDEREPDAVIDALADAAAPYRVERDVKIVALAAQTGDLRAEIAKTHDELTKSEAAMAAMRAEAETPRARLQRFLQTFVIFFSEHEVLVEPAVVAQGLDTLATMLQETNSDLRVVGYTDETGSATTNRLQSRRRADKVIGMLVERGVPRERLALAPRAYTDVLIDSGPGYLRNRRVTFELPYAHEFDIK